MVLHGRKNFTIVSPNNAPYLFKMPPKDAVVHVQPGGKSLACNKKRCRPFPRDHFIEAELDAPAGGDVEAFPYFSEVLRGSCQLSAGDILFLPPRFVHQV